MSSGSGSAGALLRRFEPLSDTPSLVALLLVVCFPDASSALDLTPGRGGFWSERVPVGVTVEASPHDFTCLPYPDAHRDVVLLDPPHNADAGQRSDISDGERNDPRTPAQGYWPIVLVRQHDQASPDPRRHDHSPGACVMPRQMPQYGQLAIVRARLLRKLPLAKGDC